MNKKVKSLLVAGLLVVGMSGNVFANESEPELPAIATSTITNPDFGDFMFKTYELQDKFIILKLTRHSSGGDSYDDYQAHLTWDADKFKVTHIKMIYDDGSFSERDILTKAEEGKDCYIAVLGEDGKYHVSPIGDDISGKKLVKAEVTFENLTKGDKPITPPDEPEEEIDDPETGDASIAIISGSVVVAGVGLYLLNRKKDDDEE